MEFCMKVLPSVLLILDSFKPSKNHKCGIELYEFIYSHVVLVSLLIPLCAPVRYWDRQPHIVPGQLQGSIISQYTTNDAVLYYISLLPLLIVPVAIVNRVPLISCSRFSKGYLWPFYNTKNSERPSLTRFFRHCERARHFGPGDPKQWPREISRTHCTCNMKSVQKCQWPYVRTGCILILSLEIPLTEAGHGMESFGLYFQLHRSRSNL